MPSTVDGNRPLVSVIVVNWNGALFLDECLESVKNQSYSNAEIIVVDNGSTDASCALIREKYGDCVMLIENPVNLGFGIGNNIGIAAAKGDFIALLNNDASADPNWLAALVTGAQADERIGMCASKVYARGADHVLDSAGLLVYRDGIARGRGRLERDRGEFSIEEDALIPSGCAALYRRSMLDEIGLFDEDFFAYCDDTDLGLRGRLAGWRCLYVPTAVAHHRYSGSSSAHSPFKAFLVERNRIWIVIKCFPPGLIAASIFYTMARLFVQGYGIVSRRGAAGRMAEQTSALDILRIMARAYATALRRLPEMRRKRREIESLRKVSTREIYGWFEKYHLSVQELALKE